MEPEEPGPSVHDILDLGFLELGMDNLHDPHQEDVVAVARRPQVVDHTQGTVAGAVVEQQFP